MTAKPLDACPDGKLNLSGPKIGISNILKSILIFQKNLLTFGEKHVVLVQGWSSTTDKGFDDGN